MGKILGIDALTTTAAATLRTVTVHVPEWDGEVILRELTGAERTELLEGVVDLYQVFEQNGSALPQSGAQLRKAFEYAAKVVQLTWVMEDGQQAVPAEKFDVLLKQDLSTIFDLSLIHI